MPNRHKRLFWATDVVKTDKRKPFQWRMQAAKQGYPSAQYSVGLAYKLGDLIEKSDRAAVLWYRRAAEQGHFQAQKALAWCYWKGTGVAKNLEEAVKWYQKAADQGDPDAKCLAENLYEIDKAHEQAKQILKEIAAK